MSWVAESLLSVGFFTLAQVLNKTNWRAGVPPSVINFATYLVAILVFAVCGKAGDLSGAPVLVYLLVIFAAVCIYVGNAASIRGFNRAPNPGYSAAVIKSYVIITLAASVVFFGGELVWHKFFGVALILTGQSIIVMDKKPLAGGKDHWAKYSFIALFSYAALAIAVKYATLSGINQLVFLFWAIAASLPFFAAEAWFKKIAVSKYKKQTGALLLMGIASGFGNIFMWDAFIRAPNMGYVNAINIASVAIISLLAVKLFGDELTRKKALGIAGVILGLLLIVLS